MPITITVTRRATKHSPPKWVVDWYDDRSMVRREALFDTRAEALAAGAAILREAGQ